uniref:Uncharacterized protein n=1 Tax=Rhizophora mucronata TaxID=61149 RepID=A0A2P2PJS8_RHIMU
MRQLQACMDYSIDALQRKGYKSKDLAFWLYHTVQEGSHVSGSYSGGAMPSVAEFSSEDLRMVARSTTNIRSEDVPVMGREVVTNMDLVKEKANQIAGSHFSIGVFLCTLLVITAFAV